MSKHYDIGHVIKSELQLTADEIISGAEFVGDKNPIHHNADHNNKKIKGLIASGSYVTAIFSSLIPSHFSKTNAIVGMEMSFKFIAPIRPNVKYNMQWTLIAKNWNEKLGGYIFELDGLIETPTRDLALTSRATILVSPDINIALKYKKPPIHR